MKKGGFTKFWQWFQAHEDELQTLVLHPDRALSALELVNSELARLDDALSVELGGVLEPKCELVISASGCRESIPLAVGLVHEQPRLQCFSVSALRGRKKLQDFSIQHANATISAGDVLFRLSENRRLLDVELYINEYDRRDHYKWLDTAYALLDAAVGEFDVATKIGEVSIFSRAGISTSATASFLHFSQHFDDACHNLMNSLTRLSEDTRRETLLHRHLGLIPERLSKLNGGSAEESQTLSLECFFIAPNAPAAQTLVSTLEQQTDMTVFADSAHTVLGDVYSVTCYLQVFLKEQEALHETILKLGTQAAQAKACLEDVCLGPHIEQSLAL